MDGPSDQVDDAEASYEMIRRDFGDVERIASSTGFKAANITKVKRHVFLNVHYLDRYVALGVEPAWARFDADPAIAEAWTRLGNGTHTEDDLQLLRHEAAEAWFERKHGPGYHRAHTAALSRFRWPRDRREGKA